MSIFKNLNCPICKSKINNKPIITPENNPISDIKLKKKLWTNLINKRIFFPYHRCNCGILTNKFFLDKKTLKYLYSDMKDNVHANDDLKNDIKTKTGYLNQIHNILNVQNKKLKVLEIGADNGTFLKLINKTNSLIKSSAIEPNKRMHKKLRSFAQKIYLDIKKIPKKEKYDLIIAIHVFDHIPELLINLKILKNKLNKGGFIYGVVHDEKSIMAKILGNRWPAYCLQHPHLFNHSSIHTLLYKKLKLKKQFIKKTVNFFNLGFLIQHLFIAVFKTKLYSPSFFSIGLRLGNFSFLYKK